MQVDKKLTQSQNPTVGKVKKHQTLELCFISFIMLSVAIAFFRSLTYDFVSARTPLVILVPLLILSCVLLKRIWKESRDVPVKSDLSDVAKLRNREFNGIAGFLGWMVLLLVLIYVTGHYVGMAVFMFFLMNMIAGEKLVMSASVSAGVTLIIYLLFEHLFTIELYRGLIYRVWAGYGIF